jgi:hypothetical protein
VPSPAVRPLAALFAVGVLLAGCGGEQADSPAQVFTPGLLGALGKVRATPDTRVAVEYGAPARVRELGERFRMLEGYGFGTIANSAKRVDDAIGVDLGAFDEAILVGQPPRWGVVLWGDYDVAAVDERLDGLGVERSEQSGGTLWTSGEDFAVDLAGGPFAGVVQTNEFNDIRTADGSFAFAPAVAGVEWVTDAGGGTLAGDEEVGGLARCLGDVVAARIDRGAAAGAREDGTEVFCVAADKDAVEASLDGAVPSTREPWEEFLAGLTVEQDGDLVRVTAPGEDGEPVGRALRAMMTGDLRNLM